MFPVTQSCFSAWRRPLLIPCLIRASAVWTASLLGKASTFRHLKWENGAELVWPCYLFWVIIPFSSPPLPVPDFLHVAARSLVEIIQGRSNTDDTRHQMGKKAGLHLHLLVLYDSGHLFPPPGCPHGNCSSLAVETQG